MLPLSLAALCAAVAAFVLPAFDAQLPGGAIAWQCAAVVVAIAGAVAVHRSAVVPAMPARMRWLVRGAAWLGLVVALFWVGAVALLWLFWPR